VLEPHCGMVLMGLGRARVMQGRAADAMDPLHRATTAFPEQVDPHVWYGRALNQAARPADALAQAQLAIAVKPGSVEAQGVAQVALRAEKRYAEAHAMVAAARGVANAVAWDCFDGVLYALQDRIGDAAKMTGTCSGSPDPVLYKELTAAITEAVARAEAAAPAAEPCSSSRPVR